MAKLQNIGNYPSIQSYVKAKLDLYSKKEKNFNTLFEMMFSEKNNIMAEITDGYKIKKITYGEFKDWILETVPAVKNVLAGAEHNSLVGIYMENSMNWLVAFWAVLICGCRPLLLNTRINDNTINSLLKEHSVFAVISDNKEFEVTTFKADDILIRTEKTAALGNFGTEVIFMSSGTTEHVKLCSYNGENFYHQICCSYDIVKKCPDISTHYKGELRQLTLLPFYHVFGFIAVYLWFGFFSRTFVFLKDMNPQTILNTVRKHKVTHIFAVPLVWDTVYTEAMRKIKARGEKTYNKFFSALNICNSTGKLGNLIAAKLLGEIRDSLFGDSVKFMISGGSYISTDVVKFFNGIGYPLVNGYGMTEIGITSVEMTSKKKIRNLALIGQPFAHVEYKITENGELTVKSNARACRIITHDSTVSTNYDEYFNTHDLANVQGSGYSLLGRADDLIICENGENLNPLLAENLLNIEKARELCIFNSKNGPAIIISAPDCYTEDALKELNEDILLNLKQAKLNDQIKKVVITPNRLMEETEFKISRRRIARKYNNNEISILTLGGFNEHKEQLKTELERKVLLCFCRVLEKSENEIGLNDDFFTDLGGSSLDYFILKDKLNQECNIQISDTDEAPTTVRACIEYLTNK